MATERMIARERKRILLAGRAYAKREALKNTIKSPYVEYEEKSQAVAKLNKSKRDESPIRIRNRCRVCGRSRGVYRKFGLCRIHLREAFVRGDVPGLLKASW
jgi:small subunit ribosomal protein S14